MRQDRLEVKEDVHNERYEATWNGRYQAFGKNPISAVSQLNHFMMECHTDTWHNGGAKEAISLWMKEHSKSIRNTAGHSVNVKSFDLDWTRFHV